MKQVLIFLTSLFPFFTQGQDAPEPLTATEKQEVVDSISAIMEQFYVFPDVAIEIAELLRSKHKDGLYESINEPIAFADQLTQDIRAINNDLHLRVRFDPAGIAERRSAVTPEDSLAFVERQRQQSRDRNFGFEELKLMEGNIGYLKLQGFWGVNEESGQIASAAMNFLSNANAIIIDLRTNGGGSPNMVQLLTSYLMEPDPVHLNSFYLRETDEMKQFWTLPYVPGNRRPDVPVYVLTSGRTFSAAEEFTYNLRNLERATIVGETTGGGAHPGGTRIATERFTVWVADGKAVNPITETNWEGTGVKPHIQVPANEALVAAHEHALESMIEDGHTNAQQMQWTLDGLRAKGKQVELDSDLCNTYAGNYGPRQLTCRDGQLYYQRVGNPEHQLIPMTKDQFMIEDLPYFRLKMIWEGDQIVGVMGLYSDGRTDENQRTDGSEP